MFKFLAALAAAAVLVTPAVARIEAFPSTFHTQMVETNGTSLFVRVGGQGPAVILLHGFGDTGDMWAPLAAVLVKDHTVIVPDLRGMGLSAHPGFWVHQEKSGPRYCGGDGCAAREKSRPCDSRHRQYGGLRAGGTISAAHYPMGGHRCAATRYWQLGDHSAKPPVVALQLPGSR